MATATAPNRVVIEKRGRRFYATAPHGGDTYVIKRKLRAFGFRWDPDAKQWWSGKASVAGKAEGLPIVGAMYRKFGNGDWGVVVFGEKPHQGEAVEVEKRDGSTRREIVTEVIESKNDWEHVCRFERAPREPKRGKKRAKHSLAFVGERGEYQSIFEADRTSRTPAEEVGQATWLKHEGKRLAVVLVGYEPARFTSQDTWEDMGHAFDSGYYGTAHYRAATREEYIQLQADRPRVDGTWKGEIEIVDGIGTIPSSTESPSEYEREPEPTPEDLADWVRRSRQ